MRPNNPLLCIPVSVFKYCIYLNKALTGPRSLRTPISGQRSHNEVTLEGGLASTTYLPLSTQVAAAGSLGGQGAGKDVQPRRVLHHVNLQS